MDEGGPLRAPFARALASGRFPYRLQAPLLAPVLGAALYAARAAGKPLPALPLQRLADAA